MRTPGRRTQLRLYPNTTSTSNQTKLRLLSKQNSDCTQTKLRIYPNKTSTSTKQNIIHHASLVALQLPRYFSPTHLLKLVTLSSRLPHHERHSPQDKVELLARAGEVAHGEGLVGGLQALQQSGSLEGDGRQGVLERPTKKNGVSGGGGGGHSIYTGKNAVFWKMKKTKVEKKSRHAFRERYGEGFASVTFFFSRARLKVP